MKYEFLSEAERDEILVEFMMAQERDRYCHEINLERYNAMLREIPDGPWKERVAQLKAETEARLAEVDSIIAATRAQLPPRARCDAALARIAAKREG